MTRIPNLTNKQIPKWLNLNSAYKPLNEIKLTQTLNKTEGSSLWSTTSKYEITKIPVMGTPPSKFWDG